MVDDEHSNRIAALQLAQIGKERGDLAAGVLIDAAKAHERIEDQQAWLQRGNGLLQSEAIGRRSSRRVGAVMTWMSRSRRSRPAAAMPSRRRRTISEASS